MTDPRAPVFSVVLPTYGRPAGLLRSLGGLAALDYPRNQFEVIVVSDGPGIPGEIDLRTAADGVTLRVERQAHRGPAAARNRGAALAQGRYLAFIDDDCVPDPAWLAALGARLASDPALMVGGRTINGLSDEAFPDATQLLVDFMTAYFDGATSGRTRFFATSNLAIPTARFREMGGFDSQFAYAGGEDRDFCARWHHAMGHSAYEPAALVYHYHRLNFRQYLDQHFRYGRGALRFHRASRRREGGRQPTPLRFYKDLVLYPMKQRGGFAGATRSALLVAAQGATVIGYWWERAASVGSARAAPEPLEDRRRSQTAIGQQDGQHRNPVADLAVEQGVAQSETEHQRD